MIWLALAAITLFFAGFGSWASLAPLASAAVAPGIVAPDGNRKTVQHLEGGIIREIRVANDQLVKRGDVLVVLEDTQARAACELLQTQHDALAAQQARLIAEQTGATTPAFPAELLQRAETQPAVADLVAGQRQLFAARRQALGERRAILRQQIEQLEAQIQGLRQQIDARGRELALIKVEVTQVADLVKRGYERKPRLLQLQRRQAVIEGDRAEYRAAIARAEQTIEETKLKIVNLDAERQDQVAAELDKVRGDLPSLRERLLVSRDVLRRTEVLAPVDGRIVELRYKTAGGVVAPGAPILDIVPVRDQLLIDARVAPVDIDVVRPGLKARVHLLAYRQRNLPQIDGEVRQISPDSLVDKATGERYFLARVTVDLRKLHSLAPRVSLSPGMPAEVLIMTGERTLIDYLLRPIVESIRHSFIES